jgi:outer membrane protein with beta-barrel domain
VLALRRLAVPLSLSLVALSVDATSAAAQRRVQPALVLGLASSTIDADDDDGADVSRRNGFAVGALFVLPLGTNAGLETGLLYVQKGAKAEEPSVDAEVTLNLAYVQVPLFLRYTFPAAGARPYIGAGGAIAYQFSCDASASFGGLEFSSDCDEFADPDSGEPFASGFEKVDASLLVGGGIETNRLTFGVRYDHGLLNLVDNGDGDSAKNRTILIFAGIKLGR